MRTTRGLFVSCMAATVAAVWIFPAASQAETCCPEGLISDCDGSNCCFIWGLGDLHTEFVDDYVAPCKDSSGSSCGASITVEIHRDICEWQLGLCQAPVNCNQHWIPEACTRRVYEGACPQGCWPDYTGIPQGGYEIPGIIC